MEKPNPVDTILQEGVDFEVTIKKENFLHRIGLLKKSRKFVMYPITLGSLLKIARCLKDISYTRDVNILEAAIDGIVQNKDLMVQIIAIAIKNAKQDPPASLVRFLDANLTSKEALQLLTLAIQQMDIQPFLAFMVSVKGMNLMAETGSISGESSEESSNTSDSPKKKSSGDTAGQT